jgi:hypothetical protein
VGSVKPSIIPQSLEAPRAQLDVPESVLNILVPEIRLNKPEIRAALCQVVSAGMSEHMRMRVQGSEASALCRAIEHQLDCPRCQGPATLRGENKISRFGTLPKKPTQSSNFHPAKMMITAQAAFQSPDVENPMVKIKLRPAGFQAFADTQPVSEQNHDKGSVSVAISTFASSLHQFLHFRLEKVLALSRPTLGYCSLYGDWQDIAHSWNPQVLHRVASRHCS